MTAAEIDAAIAAGKAEESRGIARAVDALYRNGAIDIAFQSGVRLDIPVKLLHALRGASVAQIRRVTIVGENLLHWDDLDVDYYVPELMHGALTSLVGAK
ncbi:MAG: DUF2442 domain-containing protein [Candidatus Tyrphobacter sp.]